MPDFSRKLEFCLKYNCVTLCGHGHNCMFPEMPEEINRCPGTGVKDGYEPPDIGAGNQIQVHCKSKKHS